MNWIKKSRNRQKQLAKYNKKIKFPKYIPESYKTLLNFSMCHHTSNICAVHPESLIKTYWQVVTNNISKYQTHTRGYINDYKKCFLYSLFPLTLMIFTPMENNINRETKGKGIISKVLYVIYPSMYLLYLIQRGSYMAYQIKFIKKEECFFHGTNLRTLHTKKHTHKNRKSITIKRHFDIANQILNCPFYGTLFVLAGWF